MKKQGLFITTNLLSLVALFLLFSSFTYLAIHVVVAETKHTFWTTLQAFSFEKLEFWQKTALALGVSGGGYALFHRRYRRHYGEGMGCLGCLGVLGVIILGVIVIALLPVLLVVGLVMLILGIPFPRNRGRRYRRRW